MDFLIDNFKHLTTTPENVEQLKELVLQMAVQGKLTAKWREDVKKQNIASPDDPNYNARAVLEKVKTEKEQLIKEGKIKRQKPLSPIADEEKPFELPESWEWVRLQIILNTFLNGNAYKSTDFNKTGTNQIIRLGNVKNYFLNLNANPVFISDSLAKKTDYHKIQSGDVLFTMTGTRAKKDYCFTCLIDKDCMKSKSLYLNQRVACLRFSKFINLKNIDLFLKSDNLLEPVFLSATGSANQANIGKIAIEKICYPLPPLAEQQAIVSQVEKLFTQIDELYALAQKRLNYREKSTKALYSKINHAGNDAELQETWQTLTAHFHTLTQSRESVKQLRQSILQKAVQGKLTSKWREENPDMESASVLLEKIKAEKEQLIKEGNIKRQKTLPSLSEDEIPFKLPESWEWIRLSNTGAIYNGNSISKSDKEALYCNVKNGIPYLSTKDIGYGTVIENYNTGVYIPRNAAKFKIAKKNSVLICSEGGSAGKKISYITSDICFGNKLLTNSNFTGISSLYVFYLYQSSYFSDVFKKSMSGLIGGISMSNFKSLPFALPPHKEQKAIVFKVKQLMSWCDELENKIEKRDNYQEKMMQAVVKQALKTEKV